MILLVDIGNSRLKWNTIQAEKMAQTHAILHVHGSIQATLIKAWQVLDKPEGLRLACVGSPLVKQQLIEVVNSLWPNLPIIEAHSVTNAQGITNAYPVPHKLGVDRWLAMIGAFQHYKAPFCIVSCGTAITLDIVNEQGMHLGGMIMPGLRLMQQALQQGTSALNINNEAHPLGLASYTEAGIYNGCFAAVKGFIEMGLAQYDSAAQLILAGGDAVLLQESLQLDAIIDLDVVMHGLVVID
ncbi:MAG: type III pantothenate kinase [Methyloprofundus sp.]|nr:MAG: type III pantothenate kinase [Methyloprofundus sp.]